ncbi:hypothetical protein JTE90_027610 [Oedothorax gibbosus]|uniref:Speckle-type POZ protein n=1 Tax=Oedothorax gibbosus TaxID=931172 RepID=A0AAV6VJD8_9ARAC|nr:hypothetical protein JTE90_027610 [Oedothorax gibbosus]
MSSSIEDMSDSSVMFDSWTSEETEEKRCLTYIWKIQNFSYCIEQQGDALESPPFSICASNEPDWKIRLYPRGEEDTHHIALYLQKLSDSLFECDLELSFLASNGASLCEWEEESCTFLLCSSSGTSVFASRDEICDTKKGTFLPDDTLTVCCRIRTHQAITTGEYHATTQIGVNKMSFTWCIENFSELLHENPNTTVTFGSKMKFNFELLAGKEHIKQKLMLKIKPNVLLCVRFCKCRIDILRDTGVNGISAESYFNFVRSSNDIWQFSLNTTKKYLLSKNDTFLPNDILTLRCIFTVSVGDQLLNMDDSQTSRRPFPLKDETQIPHTTTNNTLKDDILSMYHDHKFTDVVLKVGETFCPAHKSILAARSGKFCDMFQNSFKKEEIDLDDYKNGIEILETTMCQMLHFLYTDCVEEIKWVEMSLLSYAAKEYDIKSFKDRIPSIVESRLSIFYRLTISNVCEVLHFVESGLKDCRKVVLDFFIDHDAEILQSEEWEKFAECYPRHSIDILRQIYLKKLSK